MTFNRIAGLVLLLAGSVGFLTVADDLRHGGEFVGVASIAVAGFILIGGSFQQGLIKPALGRWMASGLLTGIVLGAALDNMLLGVASGLALGAGVGIALSKSHQHDTTGVP